MYYLVGDTLEVTRYHSLAIKTGTLPEDLSVTASVLSARGEVIMAVQHRSLPLWGVQFHPESVLTQGGHRMLANWLAMTDDDRAVAASEGLSPLVHDASGIAAKVAHSARERSAQAFPNQRSGAWAAPSAPRPAVLPRRPHRPTVLPSLS